MDNTFSQTPVAPARSRRTANRSLYCTEDGLFVGPGCPLVSARHECTRRKSYSVRPQGEIDQLLNAAYGTRISYDVLRPRLDAIAKAFDDGNLTLAWIETLQLRLPRLLDDEAGERVGTVDLMLKAGFNPDEPRNRFGEWTDGGTDSAIQPLQVAQGQPFDAGDNSTQTLELTEGQSNDWTDSSANTLEIPQVQSSDGADDDSTGDGLLSVSWTDGEAGSHEPIKFKDGVTVQGLSAVALAALQSIVDAFYQEYHEEFTVSDTARTPLNQAQDMYRNFQNDVYIPYKDRVAYEEINAAYLREQNLGAGKQATIDAMEQIIAQQVADGTYISDHLTGDAVDIRISGLSSAQVHELKRLATKFGFDWRIEPTDPPILHLQLRHGNGTP